TALPTRNVLQRLTGYWGSGCARRGIQSESTIGRTRPSAPSRLHTSSPARFGLLTVVPKQVRRIGSLSWDWGGRTAGPSACGPGWGLSPQVRGGGRRCFGVVVEAGSSMPPGPVSWLFAPSKQVVPFAVLVSQFIALQYGLVPKPLTAEFEVLGER